MVSKVWCVLPLNVQNPDREVAVPRPARNRAEVLGNDLVAFGGDPSKIRLDRQWFVKEAFTSEQAAVLAASELSTQFPTIPFAVMAVDKVFETTTPNVIQKRFNADDELVLI